MNLKTIPKSFGTILNLRTIQKFHNHYEIQNHCECSEFFYEWRAIQISLKRHHLKAFFFHFENIYRSLWSAALTGACFLFFSADFGHQRVLNMSPHPNLAVSGHYHFGGTLQFSRRKIYSFAAIMSDKLSSRDKIQFQLQTSCSSSPLQYAFQQRAASPCLPLKLPQKLSLKMVRLTTHLPFEIKPGTERIEECLWTMRL